MDYERVEFQPSPWQRRLATTWPLFRAFRVDVRVSWTVAIWPVLLGWSFSRFLPWGEAIAWGAAFTVGLFACTWTHEMGHIWMGRRCGVETPTISLSGLGGLAHMDAPAQRPRDEILISLAGPATHLAWLAVLWPAVLLLRGAHQVESWFWMLDGFRALQLSLMIFNLLPVYPLDGGRVLRGALATRMHANRASLHTATVGFVGNGALIVLGALALFGADPLGYGAYGVLPLWIGFNGIHACRRLRLEAQHGEIYAAHDPFAAALIQSRSAMDEADDDERREREARHAARAARTALQEKVDRLLDRVNEVGGVANLTSAERKELERASRELAKD